MGILGHLFGDDKGRNRKVHSFTFGRLAESGIVPVTLEERKPGNQEGFRRRRAPYAPIRSLQGMARRHLILFVVSVARWDGGGD